MLICRFIAETAVMKETQAIMSLASSVWTVGPTTQCAVAQKRCPLWPQTSCIAIRGIGLMVVEDLSGDLAVDGADEEKVS